jgi:hypothetical protein
MKPSTLAGQALSTCFDGEDLVETVAHVGPEFDLPDAGDTTGAQ